MDTEVARKVWTQRWQRKYEHIGGNHSIDTEVATKVWTQRWPRKYGHRGGNEHGAIVVSMYIKQNAHHTPHDPSEVG